MVSVSNGWLPDIDRTRRLTFLASNRATISRRSPTDTASLSSLVTVKVSPSRTYPAPVQAARAGLPTKPAQRKSCRIRQPEARAPGPLSRQSVRATQHGHRQAHVGGHRRLGQRERSHAGAPARRHCKGQGAGTHKGTEFAGGCRDHRLKEASIRPSEIASKLKMAVPGCIGCWAATRPPMNIRELPDRVSAGPKDWDHRPHSTRKTRHGDGFDFLMVWSIAGLGPRHPARGNSHFCLALTAKVERQSPMLGGSLPHAVDENGSIEAFNATDLTNFLRR